MKLRAKSIKPSLEQIQYEQIKSRTHVKVRIYGPDKEEIDHKWLPKLDYEPTDRDNAVAFINKLSDLSIPKYRPMYAGMKRNAETCFDVDGNYLPGHHLSQKYSNVVHKFCYKKFPLPQFMLNILSDELVVPYSKKEGNKLYKKSLDREAHWDLLNELLPSL